MVNNLLDMDGKLDSLDRMLDEDSRDPRGPNTYLLILHFQIHQLTLFRDETMHQAKKASADARSKLQQYFARLNRLIDDFDAHIVTLAKNVLPLVRAGYTDVVVKLLKIVEMEGREDEKVSSSQKSFIYTDIVPSRPRL